MYYKRENGSFIPATTEFIQLSLMAIPWLGFSRVELVWWSSKAEFILLHQRRCQQHAALSSSDTSALQKASRGGWRHTEFLKCLLKAMESTSRWFVSMLLLFNSWTVPSLPKMRIPEEQQRRSKYLWNIFQKTIYECSVSISMASEELFLNHISVRQTLWVGA